MLNTIIRRIAFVAAFLCVAAFMVWWANAPNANLFGSLVVGSFLGGIIIGLAYTVCWILGPIGRFGAPERSYTYRILDD